MSDGNSDYVYELFRKLGLSDFGARTGQVLVRPLQILLIGVAAMILSRIGARVAKHSVQGLVARSAVRTDDGVRATSRGETLAGVAASLVRVFVWTIAALLMIDAIGINPGPALAGASIVGVALGFGAQSLVKDFLSGFFVLAEDQFAVGDVITITDVTGTVEEVNLRTTRVRDTDGTVWFVPNGEIRKVGNSAKDWSRAVVDVTVPSGTDAAAVTAAIGDELSGIAGEAEWAEVILETPQVLGVESMGPDGFTVRVAAKTKPAERARVARELRARIGARLRNDGVLVPWQRATPATAAGPELEPEAD